MFSSLIYGVAFPGFPCSIERYRWLGSYDYSGLLSSLQNSDIDFYRYFVMRLGSGRME